MQKTYKKTVSKTSYIWLAIQLLLIIALTYDNYATGPYLGVILFCVIIALIWYFTFIYPTYQIENDKIVIKALFEKKEIPIDSITKIKKSQIQNFFSFWIPAEKGLKIQYNKYDEFLVSPKESEEFIQIILSIKPSIEIID